MAINGGCEITKMLKLFVYMKGKIFFISFLNYFSFFFFLKLLNFFFFLFLLDQEALDIARRFEEIDDSQYILGIYYLQGRGCLTVDIEKSKLYFQKASEKNQLKYYL